jgi:hypothetical protein
MAWLLTAAALSLWLAVPTWAQENILKIFPVKPISLDAIVREQTFAPKEGAIEGQVGMTALQYNDLEVRTAYRLFNRNTPEFNTTQHTFFVNPRWNNFIDILDFPARRPINRVLRHLLWGPLEDQVVPYLGALAGFVLPGPGHSTGYFYGANVGARFLLTRGASLDVSLEYDRYEVEFEETGGLAQRWQMLVGIRF